MIEHPTPEGSPEHVRIFLVKLDVWIPCYTSVSVPHF